MTKRTDKKNPIKKFENSSGQDLQLCYTANGKKNIEKYTCLHTSHFYCCCIMNNTSQSILLLST